MGIVFPFIITFNNYKKKLEKLVKLAPKKVIDNKKHKKKREKNKVFLF